MFFWDWSIFLIIPPFILAIYAQSKVKSTYAKYSRVAAGSRISGAEAARRILSASGIGNIPVERTKGRLSDHYDPRDKVLRLSEEVYTKPSVASLGIAAHEIGHAVQDNVGYAPMKIRAALVPAASIGSSFGYYLAFGGLILMLLGEAFTDIAEMMLLVGIVLFAAAVLFTLVTLPVELDASRRARQMLKDTGLVSGQEYNAASAVLSAAALTYVAALLIAVAQLLYFVLALLGMRR